MALLCAALAYSNAVVLSGYNGDHALTYSDYSDLDGGYIGSNDYKVLPTVAVPVHSVSASPLHIDASLDHGLHGYKHSGSQEHDYYVSTTVLSAETFCYTFSALLWTTIPISARSCPIPIDASSTRFLSAL